MKCPKCGYLGFEAIDRCRNCGYDFSLSPNDPMSAGLTELPMRSAQPEVSPLDDLSLIDAATAPPPAVPMSDVGPDLEKLLGSPPARGSSSRPSGDLLLFEPGLDDEPMIKRPSPPRAPLAVRRATPEIARLRTVQPQPRLQSLDLELESAPPSRPAGLQPGERLMASDEEWPEPETERAPSADVSARFVAVAVDLLILTVIDAVVVYFTVQICGLSFSEIGILPKGPLLAFLLVQNGGYLVAFTVGGQTLGKMAAGIKVVPSESASASMDVNRAVVRTIVWVLLAIPAGLGFLTLFSRDHRGLHDRFAGTRVIRASA
jgi:uncharacterized RDD family membrane protein YckC